MNATDDADAPLPRLDESQLDGPRSDDPRTDDPRAGDPRPLLVPRALVMLSSLWVFLCWVLLFGFHAPVQPQAASYGPSIQLLLVGIGVGVAIGWPLLRLSARPSAAPIAQAAIDGLSIFVLLQVVIWPLRLVTSWTLPRAVAIDTALAAAIMFTAGILAATQGSSSRRTRTVGMVLAATLTLAPWIALAAFNLWASIGGTPTEPGAELGLGETLAGALGTPLTDALTATSAPTLLARFSEPSTIDPSDADRALVFRACSLAMVAWAVALTVRFVRRDVLGGR